MGKKNRRSQKASRTSASEESVVVHRLVTECGGNSFAAGFDPNEDFPAGLPLLTRPFIKHEPLKRFANGRINMRAGPGAGPTSA
ncbi:unnamed protein product [Heligmosomoides polygyrus]|uniref:UBC core domain-containing protein n=1 Tax=Heligmosomoides polygyrus TaxID=6339 RepID=A0A183FRE8_HELPZ|nr:unnamed protein product [Heligmosomoides polygyrus]